MVQGDRDAANMGKKGRGRRAKAGKQNGSGKRKRGGGGSGGAVVGGGIGGSAVSWFGAENDNARESTAQKAQLRQKLRLRQLQRELERAEQELRTHDPVAAAAAAAAAIAAVLELLLS